LASKEVDLAGEGDCDRLMLAILMQIQSEVIMPLEPRDDELDSTKSFRMLSPGVLISHYKIIEKIGSGGMGMVYKAQDTKLGRTVALKFLPSHLLCDAEAKARFEHETKAAAALILTNRSWTRTIWGMLRSPNSALLRVLGGTITFVFLILHVQFARNLFRFSILRPIDQLFCALAGAVSIVWFEALKFFRKRNYGNAA
jgi:serine/threonine protein kinase